MESDKLLVGEGVLRRDRSNGRTKGSVVVVVAAGAIVVSLDEGDGVRLRTAKRPRWGDAGAGSFDKVLQLQIRQLNQYTYDDTRSSSRSCYRQQNS